MRPIAGVICCERKVGDEHAQIAIDRYFEAAAHYADCAILMIPSRPDLCSAEEFAEHVDGLLLTGSPSNVEPRRYGATTGAGPFDPGRDETSLALIDAMIAQRKPIFGICRGFQEINVAFGGSLRGDLAVEPRAVLHHYHAEEPLEPVLSHSHDVVLTRDSLLAKLIPQTKLTVNSSHFQGVDRLGRDLRIEALALDGIVEAVSANVHGAEVLGVQWHPEWRPEQNPHAQSLFRWFGSAMRQSARLRLYA